MAEQLARNATDLFARIDGIAEKTDEKLEAIMRIGEMTGTTTIRVGKCALEGAQLQLGVIDTQFPEQDMRSALVIATDFEKTPDNSGFLQLYNVDETTGVYRLMSGGEAPTQADPTDIVGLGAMLENADFKQPKALLEIQRRIQQGEHTGPTQFVDAILDPRPLL